MSVDGHVIAIGRDRAGRAEIEAASAANALRARMGAQVGAEMNVTRLVERTDEIARLHDRSQHCGSVAWIGTQIAFAQIGGCKQRRAARKVEHDVAARQCTVLACSEAERRARGWRGLR